jgi:hypothetical protein
MTINTIIVFLDIIHIPLFYLKYNVSETGFCLRLQVKAYFIWTQLIDLLPVSGPE